MGKMWGVPVILAMLVALPASFTATAHSNYGVWYVISSTLGKIEGEHYDTIPSGCDPAPDGDHTKVFSRDILDPLGKTGGYIPYNHCALVYWDVKVHTATLFSLAKIRVDAPGWPASTPLTFDFEVWMDDDWSYTNRVAKAMVSQRPDAGYLEVPFTDTKTVQPRYQYYTMKIISKTTGSTPANMNVWVDYVQYGGGCLNLPPLLDTINVDGLWNGLTGWSGLDPITNLPFDYDFRLVNARDPDGDPFVVQVKWDDGLTQTLTNTDVAGGLTTVTRNFQLQDPLTLVGEVLKFVVEIIDDPSLRCLTNPVSGFYKSLPFEFKIIPDLLGTLVRPYAGLSCHAGDYLITWSGLGGVDSIFGGCTVKGTSTSAGLPPGVIRGEFNVGGTPLGAPIVGTDVETQFSSASRPAIPQAMNVCFSTPNDKYSREFCSADYYFQNYRCTNALPTLSKITGDGMVAGLHGWLGREYQYATQGLLDPDGDPITVEWLWDDGLSTIGSTVTKAFYSAGTHPITVILHEDTTARCPNAPTQDVVYRGFMAETVADWAPTLEAPRAGWSCVADRYLPSWATGLGQDVMAQQCTIRGMVETGAPMMNPKVTGKFLLDGAKIWEGRATLVSTVYNSLNYPTDTFELSVCFRMDNDKYAREFCSGAFPYLNIGR